MTSYRDAGVDIDAGNRVVDLVREAVAATATEPVLSDLGSFGGLYAADRLGGGQILVASTDGVGTKVEVAARHQRWRVIGHDLVNHCVNDILVQGARPLFFLDYIATAKLIPEVVAEIVEGIAEACTAERCALLGGETAEMPGVYRPGAVDVAGTIVGSVDRADLLPRQGIEAGDAIVAWPSDSPHTNGYSLIRRLLDGVDADQTMIDWLLTPHHSYVGDVDALIERGVTPKALAHITGGGLVENLPRVLPEELGALIELGSWRVPGQFEQLVEWGAVSTEEAFRVWNMGVGMVAIVDAASAPGSGLTQIGEIVEVTGPRIELSGRWR